MVNLDKPKQAAPEIIPQPPKSTVERINKIYTHGLQYAQNLRSWKSDQTVREKQGLKPLPEPPKPDDYELWNTLKGEEFAYFDTARGHLKDIEEGGHPEEYSLGYPVDKPKADQRLGQGQAAMDVMIAEAGSYNGDSEKELIEAVRVKGILGAAFQQGNFEIATEVIKKYPESLIFFPEKTSRLLDNLGSFYSHEKLGDEYIQTVLTALLGETSSLSLKDKELAQYYLSETKGFNLYQVLRTSTPASASTVKELIGVEEDSFHLEATQPQGGYWSTLQELIKLSKEDKNNGLNQSDRDHLQAVIVGYSKAEILSGNQLVNSSRKQGYYGGLDESKFSEGQAKKASAIRLLVELLDENTTFSDIIYQNIPNPSLLQKEIKQIYNDPRSLLGNNQEVQRIIFEHDKPITAQRQNKELEKRQAAAAAVKLKADEEKALNEAAEAAKFTDAIEKFNSDPIQDIILQRVDYSSMYPTENVVKTVVSMLDSKQLNQNQVDVICRILHQMDALRPVNIGIISSHTQEVIDANGFLGIGKKTHQETVYTSDHSKIKSTIDEITKKFNERPLSQDEQIKKLALEHYLRLPNAG